MSTALLSDSVDTLISESELQVLTIDGLQFIFPTRCEDVVINNLRRRSQCTQWSCIGCCYEFYKNIACTSEHISRLVTPKDGYIVDIGCHIGTVALPLAKIKYPVLAIDGSEESITCLSKASIKNDLYNVFTKQAILSNAQYACDFQSRSSPYSSIEIGDSNYTTTLDRLLGTIKCQLNDNTNMRCSLIKIDTEGYEREVLEGGQNTILKHQPTLYLEINTHLLHKRGLSPNEIFNYLDKRSYRLFIIDMSNPTMTKLHRFEPTVQFPFTVENIIAIHTDHMPHYLSSSSHIPIDSPWTEQDSDIILQQYLDTLPIESPFYDYITSLDYTRG